MKKLFGVLFLSALALLTGCEGLIVKQPVPEYKTKVIAPEDALLLDCDATPPPGKEEYYLADEKKREELIVEAYRKQTLNIFACNKRWKAFRTWKQHQLSIHQPDRED